MCSIYIVLAAILVVKGILLTIDIVKYSDDAQLRKEKISIDFTNDAKAQDMLVAIMKEKNLTPEKAILSSITQKIFVRIIETGWGQVALPMWRHDNPYKKLEKLDDPVVKIKLSKDKERLVSVIMETVSQIQSHMIAHRYEGLIKKAKLKGRL